MTHVILVGRMGSGKTTLANTLVDAYGFKRWPSMTTRPPRPGEVDGQDYFFVDDEQFDASKAYGYITGVREYHTVHGVWRYGFPISPVPEHNTVSILDPKGLTEVHNRIPELFPIFMDIDPEICRYRAMTRGDDPEEIDRRMKADDEDFYEFSQVYMDFCKLRIAQIRTPEDDADRVVRYIHKEVHHANR